MNRHHNSRCGRFCSRVEGRSVDPREEKGALRDVLCVKAMRTLALHGDAFASGGCCLVARHPSGVVEFIVLSGEGYEAYQGKTSTAEPLPRRRGKVGGVQDSHNIRRGVRRWLERNADVISRDGVCLQVVRDDDGIFRLSAVEVV